MEENRVHLRHIMLFYFRRGKSVTQTTRKICSVYGRDAVTKRTVREWFARFKCDFGLDVQKYSRKRSTMDDDDL